MAFLFAVTGGFKQLAANAVVLHVGGLNTLAELTGDVCFTGTGIPIEQNKERLGRNYFRHRLLYIAKL